MTSSSTSDRVSLMNTSSSITSGVVKDALQLPANEINDSIIDGPSQLLPNTNHLGVRPLGNYKEYKPPALPDWRKARGAATAQPPAPQPQVPATERSSQPQSSNLEAFSSSRAPVKIAMGVSLDRAPTITASMSRLSLAAPAPPPRPISTGDAREDVPIRRPIQESVSPKPAKQEKEAEKVDLQPEPSSALKAVEERKHESKCEASSSNTELSDDLSTGDSGCLADALATLIALPFVQEAPAEHVLDSNTTEVLLTQRQSIKTGIEQGVIDKTLFSDVDKDGDSELHKALFSPAEYCSECQLLVAGSELSELSRANNNGFTPLIAAISFGAPVSVVRTIRLVTAEFELQLENQLVLERVNESARNTAAHYAAHFGRADAIDALFTKPTDTEVRFVEQFSAIRATQQSRITPERANLRKNQENGWRRVARAVNARNELRETPLYVACKKSNVEAARRLLQHGADPRIQEATDHRSPLHEAVLLQSLQLVRLLLDAELSSDTLELETRNGQTALELARGVQPVTREQIATRDAIVDLLERAEGCEKVLTKEKTQLQSEQTLALDEGVTDLDFDN